MKQKLPSSSVPTRVVFDTNVFIASALSKSDRSPNKELISRWKAREFQLVISDGILKEVVEKLIIKGIGKDKVIALLTDFFLLADWVEVRLEKIKNLIPKDPTDNEVIACALIGKANFLVTYDPHFGILGKKYRGVCIMEPLEFLAFLRQQVR